MRLISAESRSNVCFHESTLRNEVWVTEEFPYSIVGVFAKSRYHSMLSFLRENLIF